MFVSIVVPVFRSTQSVRELVRRIDALGKMNSWKMELILVDDCSPSPECWETLKECRRAFPQLVKIVRLAKNVGQHSATLCGFQIATGEVVVTMDDDLQHAPEDIPRLVEALKNGADIAFASYDLKKHTRFRNIGGAFVDWLLRWLFHLPPGFQLTSFRGISSAVVKLVNETRNPFPYLTAVLLANASRVVNVPVTHHPRQEGKSGYRLGALIRLVVRLIFNYSSLPVLFVGILCGACMILSLGIATWSLYRALVVGTSVPGWASIMVTSAFLNSITLLALTVYGVYFSQLARNESLPRRGFGIAEQIL
jgi:cellulose synthase/poly-beta-1,6-N-acetylglucosamine synthase-like glycosyltransferase